MSTIIGPSSQSALPPSPAPTSSSSQVGASNAASASAATDPLANEDTFLKLMVAQLQNQDPSSPADPVQFVTQLAQFSNLEESLSMRQDLDAIKVSVAQLTANSPVQSPAPAATAQPPL